MNSLVQSRVISLTRVSLLVVILGLSTLTLRVVATAGPSRWPDERLRARIAEFSVSNGIRIVQGRVVTQLPAIVTAVSR
jgi:hypothetical protein